MRAVLRGRLPAPHPRGPRVAPASSSRCGPSCRRSSSVRRRPCKATDSAQVASPEHVRDHHGAAERARDGVRRRPRHRLDRRRAAGRHREGGRRLTAAVAVRPRRRHRGREGSVAYLFIAPNLLLLGLFVLLPLVQSIGLSFEHTNGFGAGTFAGLDNYARLVADPLFWRSLVNTLLFTLLDHPALDGARARAPRCC